MVIELLISKYSWFTKRSHQLAESNLRVRGTKLHKSTKDSNEQMEVVTVSVHTEKGTRLESDHAREDGTITKHETRSGRV